MGGVVPLRFVQEYRGRRIVTDGKLFGVEREQPTDFRYLSVSAAKAAVNSQLAIEAKRRDDEDCRRFSVESADYFGDYTTRSFACECGWRGCYNDLKPARSCCSFVVTCPTCAVPLLVVHSPSDDDIKAAAAGGNAEAMAMLPALLERERADMAWWAQALKDVSQLPELARERFPFVLDVERSGESHLVIRFGEHRVWREPLRPGDRPRFYELKRLLKKKNNGRFVNLRPTKAAEQSLDDGDTRAKLSVT